jgi:predicted Fe-S protein YdhL (DUF1289 family)
MMLGGIGLLVALSLKPRSRSEKRIMDWSKYTHDDLVKVLNVLATATQGKRHHFHKLARLHPEVIARADALDRCGEWHTVTNLIRQTNDEIERYNAMPDAETAKRIMRLTAQEIPPAIEKAVKERKKWA